jgi:hypothetical protein
MKKRSRSGRPGSNMPTPYMHRTWLTKLRRWRKSRNKMARLSRRANRR